MCVCVCVCVWIYCTPIIIIIIGWLLNDWCDVRGYRCSPTTGGLTFCLLCASMYTHQCSCLHVFPHTDSLTSSLAERWLVFPVVNCGMVKLQKRQIVVGASGQLSALRACLHWL